MFLYDVGSTDEVTVLSHEVEAWHMNVKDCDKVLIETNFLHHLQLGVYIMCLVKVPIFKKLKSHDTRLRALVIQCTTHEYWHDDCIVEQGDEIDSFYALMEGSVQVEVAKKVVAKLTADIDNSKVHYFGDIAILDGRSYRQASVRVTSTAATGLCVPVAAIVQVFGSLDQLLKEQGLDASKLMCAAAAKLSSKQRDEFESVKISDSAATKRDSTGKNAKKAKTKTKEKAEHLLKQDSVSKSDSTKTRK